MPRLGGAKDRAAAIRAPPAPGSHAGRRRPLPLRRLRRHAAAGREVRRERRPLAEPFRSDAGIIPEPDSGVLRAPVPGTAGNAGDAALRGLPDELNRTRTPFPGTGLRMACELPGEGAGNGPTGP